MGAPAWRERRRFSLPLGGRSMERTGTRDQLTGLLQRAAFEAVATYALRRARSMEEPMGAVCIVVEPGAAPRPGKGESVELKRLAGVLRHHVRGEDVLGHIGSSELCALLPGVGETDTEAVARRLDGALWVGEPDPALLRPGIGWAVLESWGTSLEQDLHELVERARDRAR